jgi:aspartyl-tRNA synthetase
MKFFKLKKTHYCGELRTANSGQEVIVNGWVQRRRDHGGLIFADLRDRTGLVQIVFSPENGAEIFGLAEKLRSEYVIAVKAVVRPRPEGTVNPKLATGEIELDAQDIQVLNEAKTPPFYIEEKVEADESIRLKYRYLDLRRPDMQQTLIMRHNTAKAIRDFLDGKGFLEIETPMLTKSTPEGARDYLVPSRVHPGEFFALPQSPQLFKQILMVAGLDRYFQIVKCFRDEDLRADRQPEFTQLDMEMSFVDVDDIVSLIEDMMKYIFKQVLGIEVITPFQRLTYQEAMAVYGSDKPDLRYDLRLKSIDRIAAESDFQVFTKVLAQGGEVKGINAIGCGHYSRKDIDDLTNFAAVYGAKGMAWMVVSEEGVKSPISKFFSADQLAHIVAALEGKPGDLLLFVADKPQVVADALGQLRMHLAKKLNLIDHAVYHFCWVVDFPLLEYDEEEKRWAAVHHPFTAPKAEDMELLTSDPGKVRAKAYDLALNGVELGGGSIRIHQRSVQEQMFSLLGLEPEEAKEKFGFLLEAFEYGTPPHGGIAFGLDRMIMLMAGLDNIRDVIAFPKTQSATCLMTQAPSGVSQKQLKELHLQIK